MLFSQQKHHVQNALHALAEKTLGAQWRVLSLLLKHWPEIVGQESAAHAAPTAIKPMIGVTHKDEAQLFITIPGALAPQFQTQEKQILERVNQLVGYGFVTKIIWQHRI